MANPQKENGYTAISNELLEAMCRTRIGGEKSQVLGVIIRKTYGYNKKSDMISLSQFCEMTQLPKASVCRAIRILRARKLIETKPRKLATEYSVNKNYEEWEDYCPYNRIEIFKRDDYICHICHDKFGAKQLEVDHVIPLWLNGSNKENNLATSCRTCNRRKGIERIHNYDQVAELPQCQKDDSTCDKTVTNPVTEMTHTKDKVKNSTKDIPETSSGEIAELIKSFEGINPACKSFYGRPPQREACRDLIASYGFLRVKSVIENTLPKTNGLPFFPTITTPQQLRDKWVNLEAQIIRNNNKAKQDTEKVGKAFW